MPTTLSQQFSMVNSVIDRVKQGAESWASQFTTDRPRSDVMECHAYTRNVSAVILAAAQMPGMAAYARTEWGKPALDLIAKAQEIEVAADAVADFIEANFPTVRTSLNAAMTALGTNTAQQNALRAQLGADLDFALTQKLQNGALVSPTISAAQLAPLVTRLNTLAVAATI